VGHGAHGEMTREEAFSDFEKKMKEDKDDWALFYLKDQASPNPIPENKRYQVLLYQQARIYEQYGLGLILREYIRMKDE
jgi:hypothetical protein